MNSESLIETINKDIQDIGKLVKNFKNRSNLRLVEIDLSLEKVRKLYDLLHELHEKRAAKKNAPPEDKPEDPNAFEMEESFSVADKQNSDTNAELTKESGKQDTKKFQAKIGEQKNDKYEIVADRLQNGHNYRNESLGQQVSSKDLSSKFQSQPISDIGAAMGLNEKFSFIQGLFNNDPDKFTETINILNNASNFNEAYSYLSDKFSWDMNDPEVQKLLDLTRRKLIIRENE